MKLSIITICLNNLDELRRTVESVASQSYRDFEYIVIDGGSTDGCKEYIAQNPRIDLWVSEPDTGIYNAMNKGVRMASGEYLLFLNSGDTLAAPAVLADVMPFLQGKDFYVGHSLIWKEGHTRLLKTPLHMTLKFIMEDAIMHQSTFIRGNLLRDKPYNERHRIVSDWEYFLEAWAIEGRSYEPMDIVVSVFYLGGISNSPEFVSVNHRERQEVLDTLFPRRVQDAVLGRDVYCTNADERLAYKVRRAMALPPIRRDAKLLRNAFKALMRDMLRSHRR